MSSALPLNQRKLSCPDLFWPWSDFSLDYSPGLHNPLRVSNNRFNWRRTIVGPGTNHALEGVMSATPEEIALLEYEVASLRLISQAALAPCIRRVARQRLAMYLRWLRKLKAPQLVAPNH
jgi:hypothetical protein